MERKSPRILVRTIQDYVQRKDLKVIEEPGELDFVILSMFSYLKFEDLTKEDLPLPLSEFYKKLNSRVRDARLKMYYKYAKNVGNNPRYKDITIVDFEVKTVRHEEMQFAALTFMLPNNEVFISFRGTDDSLIGWKEDLNMSFLEEIPSMNVAKRYTQKIMKHFPEAKISMGGHSKGGLLAIYSGASLIKEEQERINYILDMDSPGLQGKLYESEGYINIIDKIHTFLPSVMVVGLIFRKRQKVTIIKSYAPSIFMHDGFYWGVKGHTLHHLREIDSGEKLEKGAFNKAMEAITIDERKELINVFYSLIENKEKSLTIMEAFRMTNFFVTLKRISKLSKEERNHLNRITRVMMKGAFNSDDKRKKVKKL